jgi:RNA 3'-terminal phosphate cyclase
VARVHGGTHVPFSPSGHYLRDVTMPMLLSLGAHIEIYMEMYGWVPEGGGTISAYTAGPARLTGLDRHQRGPIERVIGTAVGCNLPSHIPQRIANRTTNLLGVALEVPLDIRPVRTRSISTGAGLFLAVEYTNGRGGFGILGHGAARFRRQRGRRRPSPGRPTGRAAGAGRRRECHLDRRDHAASADQYRRRARVPRPPDRGG